MHISEQFQTRHRGEDICTYSISNGTIHLSVSNFGCTITSIVVPGKDGSERNIVLAYDSAEEYLDDPYYIGSTVGRVTGRISKASFTIDGTVYRLPKNETSGGNHLHGGYSGFNKKIFQLVSQTVEDKVASLLFYYRSPDGEESYPGCVDLWVTFQLTRDNKVIIQYKAVTDKRTHVNLTNHSYFNFSGLKQPATDHELFIDADSFIDTDRNYIPTGIVQPVAGTVHDFRKKRRIGEHPNELPTGYNECFILNKPVLENAFNAVLYEPQSGISMGITTSYPGILLYTGDFLDGQFLKSQGLCLETQFFPDTPNQPGFPSTLLSPGEEYLHETVLTFNSNNLS